MNNPPKMQKMKNLTSQRDQQCLHPGPLNGAYGFAVVTINITIVVCVCTHACAAHTHTGHGTCVAVRG